MSKGSGSFLKKRTKKLLDLGGMGDGGDNAHGPASKVFLLHGGLPLFVHKKKCLLPE
jgi:hypothetical protein